MTREEKKEFDKLKVQYEGLKRCFMKKTVKITALGYLDFTEREEYIIEVDQYPDKEYDPAYASPPHNIKCYQVPAEDLMLFIGIALSKSKIEMSWENKYEMKYKSLNYEDSKTKTNGN